MHRVNRRLFARLSAEKVAVIGVKGHARRDLKGPVPESFRTSNLGFQREAVGADVHEFVLVILSERRGDAQTHAEDQILAVILELRCRQRRRADESHRKSKCRVPKADDKTLTWQTKDETFRRERAEWHEDIELPGLAKRADGPGETDDADVRFVAHVLQR